MNDLDIELELDLLLSSLESKGLIEKVQGGYILTAEGQKVAILSGYALPDTEATPLEG